MSLRINSAHCFLTWATGQCASLAGKHGYGHTPVRNLLLILTDVLHCIYGYFVTPSADGAFSRFAGTSYDPVSIPRLVSRFRFLPLSFCCGGGCLLSAVRCRLSAHTPVGQRFRESAKSGVGCVERSEAHADLRGPGRLGKLPKIGSPRRRLPHGRVLCNAFSLLQFVYGVATLRKSFVASRLHSGV